ncbi:MAG: hypothetical protein J1F24_07205 [Oscillospiraceae bacterium]|nr:hypothetical protein [Oscillospiraceae bacterium]
MRKKISLFLIFVTLIVLCGCSREAKMGIGEFSDRINKDYGLILQEESMLLEKNEESNTVYCKIDSFLFVFYLGSNNNISGVSAMLPKENESELAEFLDDYEKCVSVFTLNSKDSVEQTFQNCKITVDNIKFTDGNQLNTVGKFKYSVITNEFSVTIFCERV